MHINIDFKKCYNLTITDEAIIYSRLINGRLVTVSACTSDKLTSLCTLSNLKDEDFVLLANLSKACAEVEAELE